MIITRVNLRFLYKVLRIHDYLVLFLLLLKEHFKIKNSSKMSKQNLCARSDSPILSKEEFYGLVTFHKLSEELHSTKSAAVQS